MPIPIKDIIEISWPKIKQHLRRPKYRMTPVTELQNWAAYRFSIYHTGDCAVTVSWTAEEERQMQSEAQRILFAKQLIENAIRSLDQEIERRNGVRFIDDAQFNWVAPPQQAPIVWNDLPPIQEQEVIDVDFSED